MLFFVHHFFFRFSQIILNCKNFLLCSTKKNKNCERMAVVLDLVMVNNLFHGFHIPAN